MGRIYDATGARLRRLLTRATATRSGLRQQRRYQHADEKVASDDGDPGKAPPRSSRALPSYPRTMLDQEQRHRDREQSGDAGADDEAEAIPFGNPRRHCPCGGRARRPRRRRRAPESRQSSPGSPAVPEKASEPHRGRRRRRSPPARPTTGPGGHPSQSASRTRELRSHRRKSMCGEPVPVTPIQRTIMVVMSRMRIRFLGI